MLSQLILSSSLLGAVSAFPDIARRVSELNERIAPVAEFPEYPGLPNHATYNKFDPASQLVSTTGDHAFIAPDFAAGDIRGPCAGLNAAANHGYLPRSGIATAETVNTGLWEMFGLDKSATLFLQTATMFFDGDPISGRWSIGPHSDKTESLGALSQALGNETGICAYGHLKTEADASITRGDWLSPEDNSNCASYPKFAQELLDLATKRTGGNITPRVMAEHSYNRKLYSINTNPNYFAPPYAGVAFTFGAHMFAFELLGNHSAEEPRGFLTPEVFESFFSYTRDSNNQLVFTYGHERIPDNWYKRADDDAWTLGDILASTSQQCAAYPTNCQVGGNTGTTNSFTGVDLGNITGGLYNAQDLTDPAKMGCFISQNLQAEIPSFLSNIYDPAGLKAVTALIPTMLMPALAGLGECSNMPAGRTMAGYGGAYPGAQYQNSGPRSGY